jgi:hypothetical protein
MAQGSEPQFGDPHGSRGRTVFYRDDAQMHWMCQDFICRQVSDARDALAEFARGSRVSLHLDGIPIEDLREILDVIDALPDESGETWWIRGSLVILSPVDAPPPMPATGSDPSDPGDPAGDRMPRNPVLPLGSGAIDLPEPFDGDK